MPEGRPDDAVSIVIDRQLAAEDYLRFLQAGNSVYSLDALKIAGVDLTKPEPVEAGFAVLGDMVDRLEKLVG